MNIETTEQLYKKGNGTKRGSPSGNKKTMNGKPTFMYSNGCGIYYPYHQDCFTCPYPDCKLDTSSRSTCVKTHKVL